MSKNFLVPKCQGWLQENARTTCWGTATCSQGTQNDFRGCWATSCGIHQWNSVWVKTSICLPEQHLHSAGSQEVLTSTASDLHGRGNWKNRQMQLSSLKTSQDSEDSVLTLAEQKLQSIFSDPQLQRLSPRSALCLHLQLLQLSLALWASKRTSPSSKITSPWAAAAVICCCSWSSEPWASVGPACWMWLQAAILPERGRHFTGRKWSEKGSGMERKDWIIKSSTREWLHKGHINDTILSEVFLVRLVFAIDPLSLWFYEKFSTLQMNIADKYWFRTFGKWSIEFCILFQTLQGKIIRLKEGSYGKISSQAKFLCTSFWTRFLTWSLIFMHLPYGYGSVLQYYSK